MDDSRVPIVNGLENHFPQFPYLGNISTEDFVLDVTQSHDSQYSLSLHDKCPRCYVPHSSTLSTFLYLRQDTWLGQLPEVEEHLPVEMVVAVA